MPIATSAIVIQDATRSALVAPGYVASLNSAEFTDAIAMYPLRSGLTVQQFDRVIGYHTRQQAVDIAVAALPSQIPLTVQGASEDFITETAQKVVLNTNQNAVQLNGSIFTARDQVKVHVTNEANRVIASA